MSTVIPMVSRRAVPTNPNVNAAPRISAASPSESDLVRLHMAAVNALTHALHQLTSADCSPAMWAAATARAHRGLSALKQASALVKQVEG